MLFSTDNSAEEYELVYQNARETDEELLIESGRTHNSDSEYRSSTDSQTSELFETIEDYGKRTSKTPDNFNYNGIFQEVLRKYKNPKSIGKFVATGGSIILALLWICGVFVYSHGEVVQKIKSMKGQMSIEYSGKNITLNDYNPKFKNITMENYRRGLYFPSIHDINWLKTEQYPSNSVGGYYYTRNNKGGVVFKSITGGPTEVLVEDSQFEYMNDFFNIDDIYINPTGPIDKLQNHHIVRTNTRAQWRHSSLAIYWLYNVETLEYKPIQPPVIDQQIYKQETLSEGLSLYKLHFAKFSPQGNFIVFGCNHDLFIQNLKTSEVIQLTKTGSESIFNGKADWVYEEEVISDDKMFWWSSNEDRLIYISLNDTLVEDFELSYYIKDNEEIVSSKKRNGKTQQYPQNVKYKYPKPGSSNPVITFHEYNLKENKDTILTIDESSLGKDYIFYDGLWIDDEYYLMKLSDRTSRILSKKIYSTKSNKISDVSTVNVTEQYNGWVQKMSPMIPLTSHSSDRRTSAYLDKVVVDGYTHLAIFNEPTSDNYSKLLTSSNEWQVRLDSPVVYDNLENFVYTLTTERSSMDSHLIGIDLAKDSGNIYHITDVESDGKFNIDFSQNGQYLNLIYEGPLQPWQKLINMQEIHDIFRSDITDKNAEIELLLNSIPSINNYAETATTLQNSNLPTKLYKAVTVDKVNGKSIDLNLIEILPPNFNPKKYKYPLLVHAYGGPGYQFVDKAFKIDFLDVVSSTLNAIVLVIDPRGTGGQGWEFSAFANNRIGYWEPRDITSVVAEYLKVNEDFMLKEKVAIWGWSYGGFTTLKTLEYDSGKTFKFGMAVAPVTDWMFYDSIYTERYMGLPSINPNYEEISKINEFSSFKNVQRFLLMHGTSDDNVHLQNTLWLLDNLNLATVENYDVQLFPDSDHFIAYHNAFSIIYDKLLHWLEDAFSGKFDNFI